MKLHLEMGEPFVLKVIELYASVTRYCIMLITNL